METESSEANEMWGSHFVHNVGDPGQIVLIVFLIHEEHRKGRK